LGMKKALKLNALRLILILK